MRFSVIIPARNEQANLERCLGSLFGLDWDPADFEVLVVDHDSCDQTAGLAARLGAQVIKGPPGATISGLRNLGARRARGEMLAFLDADCSVPANWLREAVRYLDRDDVVCFGSAPAPPDQANWVQKAWYQIRRGKGEAAETDWLESMNMFVRHREFNCVGWVDERLITCEDYDLSLRLGRVGKLVADPRVAAVHHGEAASLGHFFRKEYWRGTSNLPGFLVHGASLRELPSVLLPVACALTAATVLLFLLTGLLGRQELFLVLGVWLAFAWQTPLLLLAAWKSRDRFRLLATLQLYLLLNLYFLARGGSLLSCRRGVSNG